MDPERLAMRKDIAPEPPHVLAIGKLLNYKPQFSRYSRINKGGVLDIIKEDNCCVYGLIYGIKRQYLHLIDTAEGAPFSYQRITVKVHIERVIDDTFSNSEFSTEQTLNCYCYEVVNKSPHEIPPSKAYMNHVRIGRKKYGVNINLIERIVEKVGYYEDR